MNTSKKTIPQRDFKLHMQLAMALGWTEIIINGGAFLGKPPGGSPHSRDQARIPNWLGDFNECITLGLKYGIYPDKSMAMYERNRDPSVEPAQALRRGLASTILHAILLDLQTRESIEAIVAAEFNRYAQPTGKGGGGTQPQ